MNDNQNYFVTRSTSRVLAEPGGKSSVGFLFGGGGGSSANKVEKAQQATPAEKEAVAEEVAAVAKKEEEPTTTNREDALKSNNDDGDAAAAVNDAITDAQKIKKKNESQSFSIFGGVASPNKESSNAYASAATTNSYNVLTDRPTSRVLRPPGGHSSIKLG
jgi:hypothetical protein